MDRALNQQAVANLVAEERPPGAVEAVILGEAREDVVNPPQLAPAQHLAQRQHRLVVAVVLHDLHLQARARHRRVDVATGLPGVGDRLLAEDIHAMLHREQHGVAVDRRGDDDRAEISLHRSKSIGHVGESSLGGQIEEVALLRQHVGIHIDQADDLHPLVVRRVEIANPAAGQPPGPDHQAASHLHSFMPFARRVNRA